MGQCPFIERMYVSKYKFYALLVGLRLEFALLNMAQDMTRTHLHKGDLFLFQLLMMDRSLDMSLTSSVGALHSAEKKKKNL